MQGKAAGVENMMRATVAAYGHLDVLINNAGVGTDGDVVELTEEQWQRILDVNLKGVFLCCKYAILAMKKSGGGSIVNIASTAAFVGGFCGRIGELRIPGFQSRGRGLEQEYRAEIRTQQHSGKLCVSRTCRHRPDLHPERPRGKSSPDQEISVGQIGSTGGDRECRAFHRLR